MKTVHANKSTVNRRWLLVDAKDMVLGRMASHVANILRGKNKPDFTPHVDTGDFVIVVNADKIKLTGKKWTDKMYYHHSGYPGGLKEHTAETMRERHPTDIIKLAVRGMLPKGPLGYSLLRKLKVYAGPDHPHQAQLPKKIDLQ